MEGDTMLALTMVLATAMTVPGNGPEAVSAEMIREPEPLDPRGNWVVNYYHGKSVVAGEAWLIKDGQLFVFFNERVGIAKKRSYGKVVDEGHGNLRIGGDSGIYRQEGNHLLIRVGDGEDRPTSFDAEWDRRRGYYWRQPLFVLHRVKPRK
jgi:hypothetical protein